MIGWWLLAEEAQHNSAWIVPNLLATTFYGENAYQAGFIVPTWAGLAYPFTVYCAFGILFALVGRERQGGWSLLLVGAATGMGLDWLCFGFVQKQLNPMVEIYAPDRLIAVSHFLYGVALSSYPSFARALVEPRSSTPSAPVTAAVAEPVFEPAPAETPASDQEIGGSIP